MSAIQDIGDRPASPISADRLLNPHEPQHADASTSGLSADELERFKRQGWIGPYPLLNGSEVAELCRSYRGTNVRFIRRMRSAEESAENFGRLPWHKSMHIYLPAFRMLSAHPAIVERIASILGPDIIAWGVTVSRLRPWQGHRWHVDVEHDSWPGVSAFIALENISPRSTLKVISGSHTLPVLPQSLGKLWDNAALAVSQLLEPASALVGVDLKPGEFFLFDGRLWHGSRNRGWRSRSAIIAQYARPDARIAIPLGFDQPVRWHSYQPPCLLVRGEDRVGINNLVRRH